MRLFLSVFFSVSLFLASSHLVLAQAGFGALGGGAQIEMSFSPDYPEPGQETLVSIDNFVSSLYGSEITWLKNGVEITEAKNKREFTITAGNLGEKTNLSVTLNSTNGASQKTSRVIEPVYLDIILEPQTHVPDFYQGRALASAGSLVNAIALLFGQNVATTNLVYTWKVNDKVLGGGGQRAQNKVSFETPMDSQVFISLDVSDTQGKTLARRSLLMPTTRPSLKFYEVNTLYGVIERPVTNFFLVGNSATLRAEPYHLDSRVYNSPDVSVWKIDNQNLSGSGNPYEVTIQKTLVSGNGVISFQVQSISQLLQGATSKLKITY